MGTARYPNSFRNNQLDAVWWCNGKLGVIRTEHLYESKDGGPILMEKYRYLEVEAIRQEREEALNAQKELNTKAISDWKSRKLSDLKERPEAYYKDSDQA